MHSAFPQELDCSYVSPRSLTCKQEAATSFHKNDGRVADYSADAESGRKYNAAVARGAAPADMVL